METCKVRKETQIADGFGNSKFVRAWSLNLFQAMQRMQLRVQLGKIEPMYTATRQNYARPSHRASTFSEDNITLIDGPLERARQPQFYLRFLHNCRITTVDPQSKGHREQGGGWEDWYCAVSDLGMRPTKCCSTQNHALGYAESTASAKWATCLPSCGSH